MQLRTAAIAVPVMVALQAWLVHGYVGAERLPAPPDLNRLPQSVDGWEGRGDIPILPGTLAQLGADRTLERLYIHAGSGAAVDVFVGWFQSQRGGATQPHSPRVCLPGAGWLPIETGAITLNTSAGPIAAQRYVVANRGQRALALYWYQSPRRVVTGEWEAKFFTFADGLRDRRTDTAIVRLFTMLPQGAADEPQTAALASAIYPLLRELLPR